jgi:hypothetical protein
MKKLYILVVALVGISGATAQPCLPEGITFTTQEQIDNFQNNYPGCTDIAGDVIINGGDITNLNGLIAVTSIWGYLDLLGNDALTSPVGLDNLTSIGGYLHIYGNDALTSLIGLDNLSSIDSMFYIEGNAALENMSGLENLTIIGTYLTIFKNDGLSSLSGLESLTSIGGDLSIEYNSSLISIGGLENVDAGSIASIFINDNSLLSSCNIQSICDFLAIPNGTIVLHNNAQGCSSVEELQEACPDDIKEIKTRSGITIIPNPSNDKITISSFSFTGVTQLSIFNVNGEKVMESQITDTETQLDISALPQGVYFVRVQDEKMMEVTKLVKQ